MHCLRVVLGAALLTAACSAPPAPDPPPPAPPTYAGRTPESGTTVRFACEQPTRLEVHKDAAGFVDRIHAKLPLDGDVGAFLVDTGSMRSFVVTPDTGVVTGSETSTEIACHPTTMPIVERAQTETTPDGERQRGVVGADLVKLDAVLDLDLQGGVLAWYHPAPAVPAGAVVLPIEQRKGWLVASGVRLDGRDVKLIVDTGAPHVFYMSQDPRPDETPTNDVDGTGNPITYFVGEGDVSLGGGAATRIPVDRAATFPTLEGVIADLGGDIDGLLGLSALSARRIVIGRDALVVVR